VMTKGRAGADEIRALSAVIAAEPEPDLDRPALYAEFADLIDAARGRRGARGGAPLLAEAPGPSVGAKPADFYGDGVLVGRARNCST